MPGFWAKYGTQTTFTFPLIKRGVVDFAQSADYTPAAGDAAISKDNGTVSDTTNTPATSGGTPTRGTSLWKLTLTATELTCGVATVQIVDAATKAVEDQAFSVYTYGNASAYFAGDWSDIVRLGLTSLPNVAQGNAGALLTSGTGTAQLNVSGGKAPATLAPSDVSGNLPANAVQIGGAVPGSATIGTVTNVTNPVTVSGSVTVGGYAAGQDPATLVLDVAASTHNTANSIGAKINTAASAGDPWATNEPGSYASGTFGNLVANALTSTTSWIFAAASYTAPSVPAALGTPRQIANTPYTKTFTANDLRTAIADQLVDSSTNTPINLTGSTVTFRMISQTDKSVKVNNASATLTDAPNGKVAYSWTGTDLDTAGLYWGWWLVTTGGKTEHFPGDGEKMTVKVVAAE